MRTVWKCSSTKDVMGCEGETRKKNLEVWRKMRRERRHRGRRGGGVAVGSTSRNSFKVDGISDPLDMPAGRD